MDVARRLFAESGYASTSLVAVAREVGIASSAVYHYFNGKDQLYRAVFEDTAPIIWERMYESILPCESMIEGVEILLRGRGGQRLPFQSHFLAGMPTVARLHAELSDLLVRRTELQLPVFRHLAELGMATGELPGFDVDTGTELLRTMVMGWFFERFWHLEDRTGGIDVILVALRAIASSVAIGEPQG
jgi:AcrR family transcriptional regulator